VVQIRGSVALVTGSNRGLGRAFCEGLLEYGAAKVYAGSRDVSKLCMNGVIPIKLDIRSVRDVVSAADGCHDVMILVNNAGLLRDSPMLSMKSDSAAREEMETNFFGPLSMVKHFAPVLARNGGGAIVNVLSVASWFTNPFMATYCASKAAAEVLTNATRIQLRSQGTHVIGVYAGYINTDMAAHVEAPKTDPRQVVERTLEGIGRNMDRVFADDRAVYIERRARTDRAALEEELQERWDEVQSRR
jgi:NAD(P)-dependent dehydrogenase (short-subunit alcohol dehydrogenase family)